MVIFGIEFARYHSYHSVFVCRTKSGLVILDVYVDDILLNGLSRNKRVSQRTFYDEGYGEAKIFSWD